MPPLAARSTSVSTEMRRLIEAVRHWGGVLLDRLSRVPFIGARIAATRAARPRPLFTIGADLGPFADLLQLATTHELQRSVMPIVITRSGVPRIEGTAFAIGAGIAMTAKHVLTGTDPIEDVRLLYIEGMNEDGTIRGLPLPLYSWSTDDQTDIALLQVRLPLIDGVQLVHGGVQISFAPPAVGSPAIAVGYTAGFSFRPGEGEHPGSLTLEPKLYASRGSVHEVYAGGRDRVMLPFPAFRLDARFDHQMSGSPIWAGTNVGVHRVVGLVATSLESDGEPVSHGSLLWPAARLPLAFLDERGERFETTLLEMGRLGRIDIEGLDRVTVERLAERRWSVTLRM